MPASFSAHSVRRIGSLHRALIVLHLPHAGVPGAAAAYEVTPAMVEAFVELESSNFRTGRVTIESSSSEQDVTASDCEERLTLQPQLMFAG